MEYLQENFPIIALLVFVFKEPIIKSIGSKFPFLVSAWVENKIDKREFIQEQDTLQLQDKLKAGEIERQQQVKREKEYWNIINRMVNFSQEVLTKQITDTESLILDELKSIKSILIKISSR